MIKAHFKIESVQPSGANEYSVVCTPAPGTDPKHAKVIAPTGKLAFPIFGKGAFKILSPGGILEVVIQTAKKGWEKVEEEAKKIHDSWEFLEEDSFLRVEQPDKEGKVQASGKGTRHGSKDELS